MIIGIDFQSKTPVLSQDMWSTVIKSWINLKRHRKHESLFLASNQLVEAQNTSQDGRPQCIQHESNGRRLMKGGAWLLIMFAVEYME